MVLTETSTDTYFEKNKLVQVNVCSIYLFLQLLGRGSQCSNNDDEKENDEVDEAQIELQCTKLVESSVA